MSARRVLALYGFLLACCFGLICRLYWLACNQTYAARAQAQSIVTLPLPARRGNFYDCSGLPLTGLGTEWEALCIPGEDSYARLYDFADADGQALLYRRRSTTRPFLLKVSQEPDARSVQSFAVPRRYGDAPLCRHLIGYRDSEGRGVSGLEAALDEVLSGTGAHDSVRCEVNAQGKLRSGAAPELLRADSGAVGVQLTISRPVQCAAEAVAAETMSTGCILVLDVRTAKVRASVSLPAFDPENVAESLNAPDSPLVNRVLCAYAVGSVFKPVLAAAALEQGGADVVVDCPGYTVVDGQVFRCAGGVPHGETNLAAALQKSCNGYFIRLGQQLGVERVRQMAQSLGFGQAVTVSGSLHAAAGELPSAEELSSSGQFANFCFGQGRLLAAPVQVAGMMNAIAADGVYRAPLFVEGTVDEASGEALQPLSHTTPRRVFSRRTAAKLRAILQQVVADGTGHDAATEHGAAGGKTGTAQTGQFDPDGNERKNLWFAGFWPAEQPQYTVVVMQDAQREPAFSSAAIFAKVCQALSLLQTP